jgi:hypothetical protein
MPVNFPRIAGLYFHERALHPARSGRRKAAWFRPAYGALAAKLAGQTGETFLNWQMVINAISRLPPHFSTGVYMQRHFPRFNPGCSLR